MGWTQAAVRVDRHWYSSQWVCVCWFSVARHVKCKWYCFIDGSDKHEYATTPNMIALKIDKINRTMLCVWIVNRSHAYALPFTASHTRDGSRQVHRGGSHLLSIKCPESILYTFIGMRWDVCGARPMYAPAKCRKKKKQKSTKSKRFSSFEQLFFA